MTTSRRSFLGALGASAAAVGAAPLFSSGRAFGISGVETAQPRIAEPIHLNFNENPYGPSAKAIAAISADTPAKYSRYFDDASYDGLVDAIARHHNLKPENIHVGAGSTEIIKICDDVFLKWGRLIAAKPAYEAVVQYAANSSAPTTLVPITPDARHDLAKMGAAVANDTGLVYICNPNNPTGTIVHGDELARFMAALPARIPVLVDEAYAEFVSDPAYDSAVRYVREGRNVIVAKTFSKIHGLAGMRIGYAISTKAMIDRIAKFTVDYTITGAAANAAVASLGDTANMKRVAGLNAIERQRFTDEMKRAGFVCAVSQANFVMVDIKRPVAGVIPEFKKRGILVGRAFDAMPNHLRVTLGTAAEMTKFYPVFREVTGRA